MELGFQNSLVLCRRRAPYCYCSVAFDSGSVWVSFQIVHQILSGVNTKLWYPRRSTAELDELFERRIKAWRFHKTETATQRLVAEKKDNDDQMAS